MPCILRDRRVRSHANFSPNDIHAPPQLERRERQKEGQSERVRRGRDGALKGLIGTNVYTEKGRGNKRGRDTSAAKQCAGGCGEGLIDKRNVCIIFRWIYESRGMGEGIQIFSRLIYKMCVSSFCLS